VKLYLILLFAVLTACTSSRERSSEGGLVDLGEAPKKREIAPQPLPPAVSASTEEKSKDTNLDELDRAIQKQDDRAIAISARQVLIQSPLDAKALNALALYHFRKGELNAAKVLLNKAIAAHDQISMLYSNLGIILQAQKEDADAIKAYRQALKVDPYNPIAAANVGAYYAQVKDYNKAQAALAVAVEKGQRDWRTLNNYGVTLMALGQYPVAEAQLKRSAELQPQNISVLMNYATLLVDHLGKPAQGLEVINKIRFIGPGPEVRKRISELENKAKSLK
jgi:Flp pilus assembly protein TadD